MPKVSINIIKEWFTNQKKPPQEQFWAWLDSFWHKDEAIPQSAVKDLVTTLQKKADLVNGVVPEYQLPFSVVTSEVITLGKVSLTGNKVDLLVHSSGANKVRVKGQLIIRTFPNQWTITPIVGDGTKVLRGFAVKGEDDFFLAEGAELPTYTEPEIPEDALQIFKITLTATGVIIDETLQNGAKQKADDQWVNAYINDDSGIYLPAGNQPSNFHLIIRSEVATPVIYGLQIGAKIYAWNGKDFMIYVDRDTLLEPSISPPANTITFAEGTAYTAKAGTYTWLKLKAGKVVVIMMGGEGGASFPEGANEGDVLSFEGGEKVWSGRLTDAENDISAEEYNRALEDFVLDGKITTEKNRNNTQDGQIAGNTAAIAGKVDKPTTDGTWMLQKAGAIFTWVAGVVQNIANTDLSNVSARIFTQGNAFTWDTAGFPYGLKNLKTSDFDTHNGIVSVNSSGDIALVSSNNLNLDLANQFFNKNLAYIIVNPGSNGYTHFRVASTVSGIVGNISSGNNAYLWMYFKSSGNTTSTIAQHRGRGLWIQNQAFKFIRKFAIVSSVSTQRVFVGLTNDFGTYPVSNNPITSYNTTGIGMESGSNKIYFVNGSTLIDTGYVNNSNYTYVVTISRTLLSNDVTVKLDIYNGNSFLNSVSQIFSSGYISWLLLYCYDSTGVSEVSMKDWGIVVETIDVQK